MSIREHRTGRRIKPRQKLPDFVRTKGVAHKDRNKEVPALTGVDVADALNELLNMEDDDDEIY